MKWAQPDPAASAAPEVDVLRHEVENLNPSEDFGLLPFEIDQWRSAPTIGKAPRSGVTESGCVSRDDVTGAKLYDLSLH
jgi:hypothetical protein